MRKEKKKLQGDSVLAESIRQFGIEILFIEIDENSRKQILEAQGLVMDECERLIQENPKRFNSGKSVLKAVESFAYATYKKIVTSEEALTFSQWWRDFEKSQSYLLDRTIFDQ